MIDDRHEELASLYALDLLEGEERSHFESELTRASSLQHLARELRHASASLAYAAPPALPPPELKSRLFATLPPRRPAPVVAHPSSVIFRTVLPWSLAAGFALGTAWFAQLHLAGQAEAALLRSRAELTEISLQSSQQQLEAERIILRQQLATLDQQVTTTSAQLTEARGQIAALTSEIKSQSDLANLKITALASMLNNSPQALAVAVWDPAKQEGIMKVEKLPALLPNQDYQIWVVDPQYPNPVDGGVFTVNPETGSARLTFKARQQVGTVNAFAVTLERKGGVPKAEGPFVLIGK